MSDSGTNDAWKSTLETNFRNLIEERKLDGSVSAKELVEIVRKSFLEDEENLKKLAMGCEDTANVLSLAANVLKETDDAGTAPEKPS